MTLRSVGRFGGGRTLSWPSSPRAHSGSRSLKLEGSSELRTWIRRRDRGCGFKLQVQTQISTRSQDGDGQGKPDRVSSEARRHHLEGMGEGYGELRWERREGLDRNAGRRANSDETNFLLFPPQGDSGCDYVYGTLANLPVSTPSVHPC